MSTSRVFMILVLLLFGSTPALRAAEAPAEFIFHPEPERSEPSRQGLATGLLPLVQLPSVSQAEAEKLEALRQWNAAQLEQGSLVQKTGFVREFEPLAFRLAIDAKSERDRIVDGALIFRGDSTITWTASVAVDGAHALRLALAEVSLPLGSRIWVYAPARPALGPFGPETVGTNRTLWLPPMEGPTVYLEIEMPLRGVSSEIGIHFTLAQIVESFDRRTSAGVDDWEVCAIDGSCVGPETFAGIDELRTSVSRIEYMFMGFEFFCSASLIVDEDPSGVRPLLLTADHCGAHFEPETLVAYFDYETDTCDGTAPPLGSVPQVSGATLLATSAESDFTLLELSENPTGLRHYLGWTTDAPTAGQTLYRLSHPAGSPQHFSTQSLIETAPVNPECLTGLPRPQFHYSDAVSGSVVGGSSGSPAVDSELRIIGQILGFCLPAFSEPMPCDYETFTYVDGAFATTHQHIAPWLAGQLFADGFESGDLSAWGG